jgi:hypothetical protein
MITISAPTSNSTVVRPFSVSGTCSSKHQVTVSVGQTQLPPTNPSNTGQWSLTVTSQQVSAGTYNIRAGCEGEAAFVNNVKVE